MKTAKIIGIVLCMLLTEVIHCTARSSAAASASTQKAAYPPLLDKIRKGELDNRLKQEFAKTCEAALNAGDIQMLKLMGKRFRAIP